MEYRRCGRSGLDLPVVSLGLWHNFGSVDPFEEARAIARRAFELGITHFDLANNYGPEPGSAEETFGRILRRDLAGHRDELIVSTKAGYRMWPGRYGDGGSRKYLLASLDQSLRRMGLEYVDIFYHHRPDLETPLEETVLALDQAVRQGKALHVGISSYEPTRTREAAAMFRELRTPFLVHQPKYNLLSREIEAGLIQTASELGIGIVAFSPLAQGLLSARYLRDVPSDSRAAKPHGFLSADEISPELRAKLLRLNDVAAARGQSLAQLAIAWVLRHDVVSSAIVGASRVSQLEESAAAIETLDLAAEELREIDSILDHDGREQASG
jgi:L-glyceraldehyde 3-phosphate reductase